MEFRKEPNAEPIPGYRLIELLGRGGCGEVWKCEVPGGLFKAVKFVYGNLHGLDNDRAAAEEELRAIEHVKAIRHPFLLSIDRVECRHGEVIIVTELADKSLHHVLEERRILGQAGLPRDILLNYLREAAEVLDLLHFQYGLQHLDIKPRNLFLVSNHVKVADFGLVNPLAGTPAQVGAITPLYAAPEVFQGQISPHADQYSLAVTYQELLTGCFPFAGSNSRQLLLQHSGAIPNLNQLPESDRAIIARALSKNPAHRFASCLVLIQELMAASSGARHDHPGIAPSAGAATELSPDAVTPSTAHALSRPQSETDTDINLAGLTERGPITAADRPPRDSLPSGHRFVRYLENSPVQERWQVEDPAGRQRLLRVLYASPALDGERFQESLMRLRSLEHPGLSRLEIMPSRPGRIVLLSDLVEQSLRDYLQRCQNRKLRGIPRGDLLSFLGTAADTLDYLYRQHAIQHVALSPRNLLLDQGRLLIDEFGLAQLIWLPGGLPGAPLHRRYAAPELRRGHIGTSCDQYSLALIFIELLTGKLPRAQAEAPDWLDLSQHELTPEDLACLERATDPDPGRRWPSCVDFVRALENGCHGPTLSEQAGHDDFTALLKKAGSIPDLSAHPATAQVMAELIRSAGGAAVTDSLEQPPELSADGLTLRCRFSAGLPLGDARLKLDALREQLYGVLSRDDGQQQVFHVNTPASFWGKWVGRQPALECTVRLARQHALTPTPIDIGVEIKAIQCASRRGRDLLQGVGVSILEQLRSVMLVNSRKRVQQRLLWPHPVHIRPILDDGTAGEIIVCRGKDISLGGVGFFLPRQLETCEVEVELPATAQTEEVRLRATLVRARPCADGWYEVGALFRVAVSPGGKAVDRISGSREISQVTSIPQSAL